MVESDPGTGTMGAMKFKQILHSLLFLTLMLAACQKGVSTPHTESAQAPATGASPAASGPTEQTSARQAVVTETINNVTAQLTAGGNKVPAEVDMILQAGGGLETGDDGRARLDFQPEGTIVRVGPNSAFSVPQITETDGQPKTTLQLFFGKVFILLNGGSLEVETASGTASVRGSLLSVQYDPGKGVILADCLEGHCGLENENGEAVELEEGESSYIEGDGVPTEPELIDQDDVQDWITEIPELPEFMDQLPDPETFPENDGPFDEMQEPDDASGLDDPQATDVPGATEEPVDDSGGGDSGGGDPSEP